MSWQSYMLVIDYQGDEGYIQGPGGRISWKIMKELDLATCIDKRDCLA